MRRPVRLALACLAAVLVLPPLAFHKPGLPVALTGDEATYLSMAASLAADGDLRCERADLERLFAEYPFAPVRLDLASDDGWASARFDRPVLYPLLAAPWVALFGANGPLALNGALFLLAIVCGWQRLRGVAGDGAALVYGLGFFVFSTALAYLYRIQPQVMVMAAVSAAMALGWPSAGDRQAASGAFPGRHRGWLSGAVLGVAVVHEPALAILALPLLARRPDGARSRLGEALRWLAGGAATVALGASLSIALTGHAWPGHLPGDGAAGAFTVDSPLEIPWPDAADPRAAGGGDAADRGDAGGARRSVLDLLEDGAFFLWGRRTGVLPYFPLVLPVLALFAAGGGSGRSRRGWLLLAALAALAVLQVIVEPVARAAHDDQVGNPHMVGVYPAFLFLVPHLPRAVIVASYALGVLVLGPLLSSNLGVVVPGGGLHAHTRNLPPRLLPFEYPALGRASGLERLELHGLAAERAAADLWAPADQATVRSDELWLLGGETVELWLESRAPVTSAVFQLRNLASGNRVTMRMAGVEEARDFGEVPAGGTSFRLDVEPSGPDRRRHDGDGARYFYRLRLETRLGEKPRWRHRAPQDDYLGVAVAFLGDREFLGRDVYAADWLGCGAPPRVAPGETFLAAARLRNAGDHAWPDRGPARVRLSYRWRDAAGREVPHAGLRTELPNAVAPGETFASWIQVRAPAAAGTYALELDPVFENVAWFSDREPESICRVEVEVLAAP